MSLLYIWGMSVVATTIEASYTQKMQHVCNLSAAEKLKCESIGQCCTGSSCAECSPVKTVVNKDFKDYDIEATKQPHSDSHRIWGVYHRNLPVPSASPPVHAKARKASGILQKFIR